jgi:hypothetical protein
MTQTNPFRLRDVADLEPGQRRRLASLPRSLEMAGGISDSTRRRDPDFPLPIVLSRTKKGKPARIAFIEDEVLDWCERKIAAARGPRVAEASAPPAEAPTSEPATTPHVARDRSRAQRTRSGAPRDAA